MKFTKEKSNRAEDVHKNLQFELQTEFFNLSALMLSISKRIVKAILSQIFTFSPNDSPSKTT